MNVAIVGSRSFTDYRWFCQQVSYFVQPSDVIISGGAQGVDSLAEDFADEFEIEKKIFEADWQDFSDPCVRKKGKYGEYNALAGFKRNSKIVKEADLVIAFWDGESTGTEDTLEKAHDANLPVIIIGV